MSDTPFAETPAYLATPRQRQFIQAIANAIHLSACDLEAEVQLNFGCSFSDLSRRDASVLIERLRDGRVQPERPDLYREPPTGGEG